MRKLFFIVFISCYAYTSFAMDLIVLKSGEEIKSKVLEENLVDIKYKEFENQDGPTYTIERSKVYEIKYENKNDDDDKAKKLLSEGESSMPSGAISLNFLGFLQFGPLIQYEAKITDNLYLVPSVRIGYLGLMFHVVWETLDDEDDYLTGPCLGIGAGLRGFALMSNDNAVYYGGIIEYNMAKVVWGEGYSDETYEKYSGLAILGNGGYRFRFQNGMFLNLGAYLGVNIGLSDKEYYAYDDELYAEWENEVRFIGFAELSFGWEF